MTNAMRRWLSVATEKEKEKLAKLARTSRANLRFIATSKRKNGITSDLASRIERAAAVLKKRNPDLPELLREHLSGACARCEFAKRCRG